MTLRALVTARPARSGRQRKEGWLEAPHHKTPATAPRRFPRGPDESATPPGSTSFPRRSQAAALPAPTPPHAWSGLRSGAAPPPRRPGRHPGTPGGNKGGGGGPSPFRAGGRRLQPHPGPRRAGEAGVESARRERPRTRDRAAESARSRARVRGPQGARGDCTGRRKGHTAGKRRRVRLGPRREAGRAARPPRALGKGRVGTGSRQGSVRPPPPPRSLQPLARLPLPGRNRARTGGKGEKSRRRPRAWSGGGTAPRVYRPEEAGAAARQRLDRDIGAG